ncbi:MAG: hypothetical protein KDA84_18955 [Planctomycetaceae bacterium]|nr:hypothetical protein [Planctomycetaceae bacterium]
MATSLTCTLAIPTFEMAHCPQDVAHDDPDFPQAGVQFDADFPQAVVQVDAD